MTAVKANTVKETITIDQVAKGCKGKRELLSMHTFFFSLSLCLDCVRSTCWLVELQQRTGNCRVFVMHFGLACRDGSCHSPAVDERCSQVTQLEETR